MKLICCMILILTFQNGLSQSIKKKRKAYQIQITNLDGTKSAGIFHSVDDSTFRIASIKRRDTTFQSIPVVEINKFLIRKKGVIGTSMAIGMFTGAVIGFATYKEPDCDPASFCFDFGPGPPMGIGAGIGALMGAAIGVSLIKKWEIKGSKERFDELRPQLMQYCFACN
jgi:hypothetical protein